MTTTSLLSHKPPPLKPRNNPAVFLRNSYYGSIGRPSSGKRKSAVELLEASKAYYVKSEQVLDARQEPKNADHLHVRSPTLDVAMLRSPAPAIINGGGPFPFAMCLTCPPYPHQHFEHFDHYQLHQNAHNHHLSQGSLHQQHHLAAASAVAAGGNSSSGPPSVESGGTASTGSTGGGGVTAITTLGRTGKHQHHQHSHHHLHNHSKSYRSSSTGSNNSRLLQENASTLYIDPTNLSSSSLKTSTMGRAKRTMHLPGCMPKQLQMSHSKKDSSNVLASLLPGMSFTLPAQSSLQKQTHHHHHHHHHHLHHHQLLLQQHGLASLSNSTSGSLSLPPAATTTDTTNFTSTNTNFAANGQRANNSISNGTTSVATASLEKHNSVGGAQTNVSSLSTGKPSISTGLSSVQPHQHTKLSLGQSGHGVGNHRDRIVQDDSPPPLPPKSPRITSKPARPHDFPQQLQLQIVDPSLESASKTGKGSSNVPPPPPRRQNSQKDSQAKYLRLLQDQSSAKLPHSIMDSTQSMTLPSPILPPTPPPDVVMESPMSDSGPIISPPPAFSTPVTPMVDRQNSTTSDNTGRVSTGASANLNNTGTGTRLRSLSQSTSHYHNITGFSLAPSISATSGAGGNSTTTSKHTQQQQQHHYHVPLSGTVSMSAISTVSGRNNSSRNNKSIPDLSSADASIRYSPVSRSRSNSSPMSPEDSMPASSPDDDDDEEADEDPTSSSVADNGHDGDDDCSEKGQSSSISPKLLATGVVRRNSAKLHNAHHLQSQQHSAVNLIPKSVTENFLYKVAKPSTEGTVEKSTTSVQATRPPQQSKPNNSVEDPQPTRRPILRSKSDLSHRYAKAEKSATLTHGFTLVQVDIGLPPPLPMHTSVSTKDFSKNTALPSSLMTGGTLPASYGKSHHHHIYETPNVGVTSSHYHEGLNRRPSGEGKRATQSAGDLERFFDMMGLENPSSTPVVLSENKDDAKKKNGSESPVFFSSVSSVDSAPRKSGSADSEDSPLDDKLGSRTVGGYAKFGPAGGPSIMVQHGEPSIVERNARVIKWLFNCRKAMERR